MKTLTYLTVVIFFTITACKKPNGREKTIPAPIRFEVIGNNGNNIINSIKDSLAVTYTENGIAEYHRLNVYKVQVSATDTTPVSKYNGFVISDQDYALGGNTGYISMASGEGGVRDFNLYLNGVRAGSFHFDYWGYLSLPYPPPLSSTCTFNGIPVKGDILTGSFSNGSQIVENADSPGEYIYVLQMH